MKNFFKDRNQLKAVARNHARGALLDAAVSKLSIAEVWRALGLRGAPARSCCSPLRVDRTPSFSISDDGKAWYDHGTSSKGGLLDFVVAARACDKRTAARYLISLAGLGDASGPPRPLDLTQNGGGSSAVSDRPGPEQKSVQWPDHLHGGNAGELTALAALRRLPGIEGLRVASNAGHLWYCSRPDWIHPDSSVEGYHHCPAWLLTDSARRVGVARRLDGRRWNNIGGGKAIMLPGSRGSWPIGAADIGDRGCVALVEGGPDFLALHHYLLTAQQTDTAPVAMPSGGPIADEALHYFTGRHVRLFCHNDGSAGVKSRETWTRQLLTAGALGVSNFYFAYYLDVSSRKAPKDLNDFLTGIYAGQVIPAPNYRALESCKTTGL